MKTYLNDALFGVLTALYSLATTRLTVGLPLGTNDEIINAVALAISSGIGGLILYRQNPSAAWGDFLKKKGSGP